MELIVVLTGIFLVLTLIFCQNKFQRYGLMTILIYTVLSIELIVNFDGITLSALLVFTVLSLTKLNIKIYDIVGCIVLAVPCVFWLGTQEFLDGFAYSYIIIGLGVAIASILLFDKQKRQTLSALALLTSFVICYISNITIDVIDIATSFIVTVILTQNYTLSIDLMTIDS